MVKRIAVKRPGGGIRMMIVREEKEKKPAEVKTAPKRAEKATAEPAEKAAKPAPKGRTKKKKG